MNAGMTEQPHHRVLDELNPQHTALRERIPAGYRGFARLNEAATTAGELDPSVKALIALAIGVAQGCDGCIASDARAVANTGATKQQAAEGISVTFLVHGGPAAIHGARACTAFCEFFEADHTQSDCSDLDSTRPRKYPAGYRLEGSRIAA